MHTWAWLLYISIFLVFYNYAGYAVLVYLVNRLKKRPPSPVVRDHDLPTVSFIVAAYNEESCIREKILNSLALAYPPEKIEFIFITDGSTDGSAAIITGYPSIKLLHEPQRRGKSAALNRSVTFAKGEVLVFSDANTVLNDLAVKNIARHYLDSAVGGVSGEKKILPGISDAGEVGEGEGLYWKYESFLKKLDSEFYSVVGAAGELFSVRRELYVPVEEKVILDDFIISLRVGQKGYRVLYEPAAHASELPSFSLKDESKRKVRIAAGGFQSIVMLKGLLLFWRQPRLSFLYISHRVLRWTVTPLCLGLALISNLALVLDKDTRPASLPVLLLAGQVVFYGMAFIPLLFPRLGRHRLFKLPYYFVFMNISIVRGFLRWLSGTQSSIWEKARRETSPAS